MTETVVRRVTVVRAAHRPVAHRETVRSDESNETKVHRREDPVVKVPTRVAPAALARPNVHLDGTTVTTPTNGAIGSSVDPARRVPGARNEVTSLVTVVTIVRA